MSICNLMAMQAVAVGFIIGVVQDSVETALNSSSDAFFTTIAATNLDYSTPSEIDSKIASTLSTALPLAQSW